MKRLSAGRVAGALAALALLVAVVAVAGPGAIARALTGVDPGLVLLAFAAAAGGVVARGLRLAWLLPAGRLGVGRAGVVAAAAMIAAMLAPARLGELALPWLLRRSAAWPTASGLATLVAARVLDLAALGVWAGVGLALVGAGERPLLLVAAAVLLAPALTLLPTVRLVDRLVARLCAGRGGRWATLRDQIQRVAVAVDELRATPGRVAVAATFSVVTWGAIWVSTWCLLAAMGLRWSPAVVLAGSAVASLASILPLNLVANLGTLEAGWTAAFVGLGVPLEVAAASGVACHLWSLLFAAVLGGAAWAVAMSWAETETDDRGRGR